MSTVLEDDRESLQRRIRTAEDNLRDTQRTMNALRGLIKDLKLQLKDVQREIATRRAVSPSAREEPHSHIPDE